MEKKRFYIFITVLVFCVSLHAQDFQQYDIQTINGVEYYIYHVKQSEGLYRISVNFGITQDEILKINPEVKDGLKAGQIIFIPKKEGVKIPEQATVIQPKTETAKDETSVPVDLIAASLGGGNAVSAEKQEIRQVPDEDPHFYYHKVQKRQTLYSLAKQYGIEQEDIIKYNPQAASGLRKNDVLRIPKSENIYPEKRAEKTRENVEYLIHKVEPKETLYSIGKKYKADANDILKLNPGLEVLSIGQELKIPANAVVKPEAASGESKTFIDWRKIFGKRNAEKNLNLRIAFLLPFVLESKNEANITRFVDFYGGAVKALYEAKSQGISIDVYTYDTGKTQEKMREIFAANPTLKEMDLIIGPTYSAQVPAAAAFAKEHQVKTLIPFTAKIADIERNPYIFQFNPGMDAELNFLAQMFETKLDNMNYIFADLQSVPDADEGAVLSRQIKEILDRQNKKHKTLKLTDQKVSKFDSVLVYSQKNLIIFNTDQFQALQPYFESFNAADGRYDIVLLEKYSWKQQESFRPLGVYVSAFKTESDMTGLEKYDREFIDLSGWKAISRNPRYDILGYDLVSYFIRLLTAENNGNSLEDKLELDLYHEGLQSQFSFRRGSTESGFINQQLYLGDSQVK